MTISIRTWRSRLKKIEQKTGTGTSRDFYASLSDEHLEALCQLTDAELEEGDLFPENRAIAFLSDCLGGDGRTARHLWLTQQSLPPDPELQRMSNEELIAYIERTRGEIRELVAEGEAA